MNLGASAATAHADTLIDLGFRPGSGLFWGRVFYGISGCVQNFLEAGELRRTNDFRSLRSPPEDNRKRSHRISGVALAGCRGNAKMGGRREAGKASDSHRRR